MIGGTHGVRFGRAGGAPCPPACASSLVVADMPAVRRRETFGARIMHACQCRVGDGNFDGRAGEGFRQGIPQAGAGGDAPHTSMLRFLSAGLAVAEVEEMAGSLIHKDGWHAGEPAFAMVMHVGAKTMASSSAQSHASRRQGVRERKGTGVISSFFPRFSRAAGCSGGLKNLPEVRTRLEPPRGGSQSPLPYTCPD